MYGRASGLPALPSMVMVFSVGASARIAGTRSPWPSTSVMSGSYETTLSG